MLYYFGECNVYSNIILWYKNKVIYSARCNKWEISMKMPNLDVKRCIKAPLV